MALVLPFGTGADGGDGMYVLCTYVFMAVCTCIFPIIYVFILNGLSSNVSELNYWTKSILSCSEGRFMVVTVSRYVTHL